MQVHNVCMYKYYYIDALFKQKKTQNKFCHQWLIIISIEAQITTTAVGLCLGPSPAIANRKTLTYK